LEGAAVESSQKIRLLVFSLFFIGLIVFAILYSPVNAVSRPADKERGSLMPTGTPLTIKAPLGLPPVPIPADNPPTVETVALGRLLYYDPILSADSTISCASCHSPEAAFADARPVSIGWTARKAHGIHRQ
jgi:cytochrome c peroxidase